MNKQIKIAPSLLDIDYGQMNAELKRLAPFADLFHLDIMDGNFVPNLSIGLSVVRSIKTPVLLDCHLMIMQPEKYIEAFANAGAASITIHAEATRHLRPTIAAIKKLGCKAAVAINPETRVTKIAKVLSEVDMVLIMSVHPGFGGQVFIPTALEKVAWIRKRYPSLPIQIDGGINDKTAPLAVQAGATVLVVGSYLVKATDRALAMLRLKQAIANRHGLR